MMYKYVILTRRFGDLVVVPQYITMLTPFGYFNEESTFVRKNSSTMCVLEQFKFQGFFTPI